MKKTFLIILFFATLSSIAQEEHLVLSYVKKGITKEVKSADENGGTKHYFFNKEGQLEKYIENSQYSKKEVLYAYWPSGIIKQKVIKNKENGQIEKEYFSTRGKSDSSVVSGADGKEKYIYEWDMYGNETKCTYYKNDSLLNTNIFKIKYQDSLITENTNFYNGEEGFKEVYEYRNGEITSTKRYFQGKFSEGYLTTYDSAGHVIKNIVVIGGDFDKPSKELFTSYNLMQWNKDQLVKSESFEMPKPTDVTKGESVLKKAKLGFWSVYTYNENGELLEEKCYNGSLNNALHSFERFTYIKW